MNTSSHADRKKRRSQRGFALLMSVLAVAGLMVMLIGLLSMLTLERKTARSYSDAARADMALQSGLAEAIGTISPIANRDDTLVFRMEDTEAEIDSSADSSAPSPEHFFTFGAQYDTQKKEWRVSPFASGFKQILGGSDVPNTTTIKQAMLDYEPVEIAGVGRGNVAVPKASWVNFGEKTDPFTMRYAWWAEDLTGRIDGAHAGSEPRDLGLDAREVGLFTIFNSSAEKDGAGPEDALITQRQNLRSTASVRQFLSEANAKIIEPFLTYNLPREINAAPLIPHGFGYPDAGQKALDINDLIAKRDVEKIASHIDRNLPLWNTTRKGGFPPTENYTKTIASSIIDYADLDSDATIGIGYRGVDSYPFVNELYDQYLWTNTANNKVVVRVTTYVELWNPCQHPITGKVQFENINLHNIRIPPAATHTFTSAILPFNEQVNIAPNMFYVLNCGHKDYEFPSGSFPPASLDLLTTTTSSFKLRWNGQVVDWARGKLQRQNPKLNAQVPKWVGNASCPSNWTMNQWADPRNNFYNTQFWFNNTYSGNTANSSFGGRNLLRNEYPSAFSQQLVSKWPDRGSDTLPGPKPTSDAVTPTQLRTQFPKTEELKAPSYIGNYSDGNLQNIAEIGNIFDPAQWNSWTNPNATPESRAGGGITLAIGRPEYAPFDKVGLRAAQLLDLFTISNASTAQHDTRVPKININTAPREVLRTLIAGQPLKIDPVQPTIFPPKDQTIGDRFADAVIAWRQHAPLRGLSDLNLIRKNPLMPRNFTTPDRDTEPFFGSREQYPMSNRPLDTWDDAGREELFQRVANMVTFQGKTYRIIVAGQVLDRSGKIIGQRTREITVRFEPKRNAEGLIDTTQPFVVSTLSERSL